MQAAVDGREIDEVLGTHVGVWLVRGVQVLHHILGQLKFAMTLGLEGVGEEGEADQSIVSQPLVGRDRLRIHRLNLMMLICQSLWLEAKIIM